MSLCDFVKSALHGFKVGRNCLTIILSFNFEPVAAVVLPFDFEPRQTKQESLSLLFNNVQVEQAHSSSSFWLKLESIVMKVRFTTIEQLLIQAQNDTV